MSSPEITLVEFEQIYDEYISLCGNQAAMVEQELIFASLVDTSLYLNADEKQAIKAGELDCYLARLKADDEAIFQPVQEAAVQAD